MIDIGEFVQAQDSIATLSDEEFAMGDGSDRLNEITDYANIRGE